MTEGVRFSCPINFIVYPQRVWLYYANRYYSCLRLEIDKVQDYELKSGAIYCYSADNKLLAIMYGAPQGYILATQKDVVLSDESMTIFGVKYKFNDDVHKTISARGILVRPSEDCIAVITNDNCPPISLAKLNETAKDLNSLFDSQLKAAITLVDTSQREYLANLLSDGTELATVDLALSNARAILDCLHAAREPK